MMFALNPYSTIEQNKTASQTNPNLIPYRTKENALTFLLAAPSKIWTLFWTPLGITIDWLESCQVYNKATLLFLNEERTAGIFPIGLYGGILKAGAGITTFDYNLFDRGKRIYGSFLYQTADSNYVTVRYTDAPSKNENLFTLITKPPKYMPSKKKPFYLLPDDSRFFIVLGAEYVNDDNINFFINRNISPAQLQNLYLNSNSTSKNDETSYFKKKYAALFDFGHEITDSFDIDIATIFRRVTTGRGDGTGAALYQSSISGNGPATLFSIGPGFYFNFTKGKPRIISGPAFSLQYHYNLQLDSSRFEYNRITAEAFQIIPVPFLKKYRNLGLRARYEILGRFADREIPFYELPMLGSGNTLRGYEQNRFQGLGSILFNLEYLYPIYDLWDAVVFMDAGQVFDEPDEVQWYKFHLAAGGGLKFMTRKNLLFRLEFASSNEDFRVHVQISPLFKIYNPTRFYNQIGTRIR